MITTNKKYKSPPLVPLYQEDQVYKEMLSNITKYNKNKVEYDLFPKKGLSKKRTEHVRAGASYTQNQTGDSYNSNSFVSGLLNASNITVPDVEKHLNVPGYNKPLPKYHFKDK